MSKNKVNTDILMFGFGEDWPVWERTGFRARVPNILQAFSREEKIEKILFVNNPASILRGYKNILLNRKWGAKKGSFTRLDRHSYITKVNEKIYTLDWIGFNLVSEKDAWMSMSEGLNGSYLLKLIKKASGILDMDNILIWTANPFVQNLHGFLNESFFLFDAIDNWLEHPYLKKYFYRIKYAYAQLAKKADLITAVSNQLKDFFTSLKANDILYLPNAVDYQHYSQINYDRYNIPKDIRSVKRPILGMVGILSNDVDFELLSYIATSFKEFNIILIGSGIEGTDLNIIKELNNIYLLGYKEPRLIPDYLASFDLCMSIYKMNASSDSKDPMKLYEYLASGKPVVCTDIREARKLNGLIRVAHSKEEFVAKIEESLKMDTEEDRQKRLLAAKENSWTARVKTILDLVESKQGSMLDLSIIIVNWNTKDLLRACLDSIQKNIRNIKYEVIVVDNSSVDRSQEVLKSEFPQVRLIENNDNFGFGRANNQGFKKSRGRHILFLNPDTQIISESISKIIDFSDCHKTIGIIGPKALNADNSSQSSYQGFPRLWWVLLSNMGIARFFPKGIKVRYNHYFYDLNQSCYVDSIGGACIIVKRGLFKKIGGFDEDFHMYGEDLDLCYRALKSGSRSYFLNIPFVIHYQNQSGRQRWNEFLRLKENYKSFYIFYRKHYGWMALFLFRFIICLGSLARILIFYLAFLLTNNIKFKENMLLNRDMLFISLEAYK